MQTLSTSISRAVALAPCSARQLAIEAGIDPSLLTRILSGERGATPDVAVKIAEALTRWRDGCDKGAILIGKALETSDD